MLSCRREMAAAGLVTALAVLIVRHHHGSACSLPSSLHTHIQFKWCQVLGDC
jgi:hypothetical protein